MSSNQIILYDLPRKAPNTTWTLNAWKGRLLLNFKGLDYRMEWLEYPQMKPRFAPHVPANAEGWPYTVPTVQLPDGTFIMDSSNIAAALEQAHPLPSLRLTSPALPSITALTAAALNAVLPNLADHIPKHVLNQASVPHWYATREAVIGKPLHQFERENGGPKAYDAAADTLAQVTALLKQSTDGPFFDGRDVGFADFVWVGFLEFLRRIGGDSYEEVMKRTGERGVHERLLEACKPWMERDAE
ncbi:hypothetical protein S40288_09087 [Stachybotrys chartarum IBT 40288]|nr:hypothetical protein S40288_09087 [Stachybotrys chartarum IBT 40288]